VGKVCGDKSSHRKSGQGLGLSMADRMFSIHEALGLGLQHQKGGVGGEYPKGKQKSVKRGFRGPL
jgi:hypothetical protein